MKRQRFLADLIRYPWAIAESYVPLVERVLGRLVSGDKRAWDDYDDREPIDKPAWEARRAAAAGYSGTIAVVPMYGVLTQRGGFTDMSEPTTSMSALTRTINTLAADSTIAGIVLDVDSPGGTVQGVDELAAAIYGARESKPIAAVANSFAASAAYWCASQCGELYAAPGAEVGSIGVYTMHANYAEALAKEGVSVEFISAGKYKVEQNSYGPLTDEARAHLQAGVDGYYESFVRAVSRGRGASLKSVREGMGQGRMLQPGEAKSEGMIDGVATLDQVISKMASKIRRSGASALAAAQRDIDILSLG